MSRLCQAPKLPLKIGLTGIDKRSKGISTNHCHPFAPPQGTRGGVLLTWPLTGRYSLIFHIPAQFLCFSDSVEAQAILHGRCVKSMQGKANN